MSEQTKFRVKEIAYAYPTSPVADKFKFRNGCWYVGVGTCYPQSRALLPGPKEIKAFATFWEAHTFAETLVQPYSGYTWTPEKYAAVHPHETRPTGCRESAAKNERTKMKYNEKITECEPTKSTPCWSVYVCAESPLGRGNYAHGHAYGLTRDEALSDARAQLRRRLVLVGGSR